VAGGRQQRGVGVAALVQGMRFRPASSQAFSTLRAILPDMTVRSMTLPPCGRVLTLMEDLEDPGAVRC
jgi:hypothetical protein